jgi:phage shock protein A
LAIVDKLTRLLGTTIDDTIGVAGDPATLLHRLLAEMADDLARAKSALADCKREERNLAKQIVLVERAVSEWAQRAMSAMRAGDDVVAKDALARKGAHQTKADELRAAYRQNGHDAESLMNALVGLNLRIDEAKHRRTGILLRAKRGSLESTITEVILEPKMPLAKTKVGEAARGKSASRDRAKVAGQRRTKR